MESQRIRSAKAGARSPNAEAEGTAPPTERQVQRTIVRILRQVGFKVYVFSDRRRVVTPGIPDLYALHPGKRIATWIEVKAPGQLLRREQQQFAHDCIMAGVPHLTVDAVSVFWDWLYEKGFMAGPWQGP